MKNQRVFFKYIEPNLIFPSENSFRIFAICFFLSGSEFPKHIFSWLKLEKHEFILTSLKKLKIQGSHFLQAKQAQKT